MSIYEIRYVMGLAYRPQSNRQAEISNREIKKILEKIVTSSRKNWSIKLDDAYKAMWAIKKLNCNFQASKEIRLLQMNELEQLRNEVYDNARIYKDKTKKWHDQKIQRR